MTTAWLLVVLLPIATVIAWRIARTCWAHASERHWLPRELHDAELALAEKTFRVWRPVALIARVDRGYRLGAEMHLTEFKTRKRAVVYPSDVIELSAQRLVVEKGTAERVSDIGYVVAHDPLTKRRSVLSVQLLPRTDVIALARRREAILSGRLVPRYARSRGLCSDCAYRLECKPEARDDSGLQSGDDVPVFDLTNVGSG